VLISNLLERLENTWPPDAFRNCVSAIFVLLCHLMGGLGRTLSWHPVTQVYFIKEALSASQVEEWLLGSPIRMMLNQAASRCSEDNTFGYCVTF
jgi:hypothetical protein